ncbi:uncharacterized protein LOC102710773 [Oryza brachyantha]|uniref:uncharacterized protein LOC102710773 n=1 Tax=Oryza brachyantha TaxID=4533 RepID=UPI001ADA826D|nr:uncharacterized protein LOC102710773 [Oryza brachyantha]
MRNHKLLVPTTTTTSSSSSKNNANSSKQEEPHLSGAYIRSLVKQLSSSSSTARSKDHTTITMGASAKPQPEDPLAATTPPPPQPQPQPQPHKKQVRRRLHTSRPYQERLLNMAEARREIVTALKIHRASMRQAKEQQQQQHVVIADDIDGGGKVSTSYFEAPLLRQPSPTSSYSVYSSPSVTTTAAGGQDMSSSALTAENASLAAEAADPSLHRVLDDEEMAALCSIGEQHDIEWSDTVNLVTSAWWSKLLDSVGGSDGAGAAPEGQATATAEDELTVTCTPDWLSDSLGHQITKERSSDVLGMHFSDQCYGYHSGSYGEDVSLPRMDLGEIEGWDAEWFS